MNNGYKHAFQNRLFLCAYLRGKRVMPLGCERVKTCGVRLPYALKPRDKPPPRDNYTERFYKVMNRDSCSFTSLSTDLKRTGLGNNLNRFATGE